MKVSSLQVLLYLQQTYSFSVSCWRIRAVCLQINFIKRIVSYCFNFSFWSQTRKQEWSQYFVQYHRIFSPLPVSSLLNIIVNKSYKTWNHFGLDISRKITSRIAFINRLKYLKHYIKSQMSRLQNQDVYQKQWNIIKLKWTPKILNGGALHFAQLLVSYEHEYWIRTKMGIGFWKCVKFRHKWTQ